MKKILVAPLNWGIGHATRCIPIIKALQESNFIPIIASDGDALQLLQKEFPALKTFELPSYNIKYSKVPKALKWKLLFKLPLMYFTMKKELKEISEIVASENISGIISDNRFGARSKKVKSVYITHQLNVLSGWTTYFSSKVHQKIINKFDECWIPDTEKTPNLSGLLSKTDQLKVKTKFIGSLSRFNYKPTEKKYDLLVLLSGPEPQRTIFENKILNELIKYKKKVFFVRGKIENKQQFQTKDNCTTCNYLLTKQLEDVIAKSNMVLSRSGYSTIMDLAALKQKAFFVPTPGQFEQEYLAKHLNDSQIAPYCNQDEFTLDLLENTNHYKGFGSFNKTDFDKSLFSTF